MTTQPVRFFQVGSFAVGNRLLPPGDRTVQSDADRTQLASTRAIVPARAAAKPSEPATRLDAAMRATGGQLIVVNATGCLEVFSTPYPQTSWRIAWLHSLFGNAPAVATGMAAAMRVKGTSAMSGSSARPATAAPSTSASGACQGCSSATTTSSSSATTTRPT